MLAPMGHRTRVERWVPDRTATRRRARRSIRDVHDVLDALVYGYRRE
jgi:hypothetical protein